MVRLHIVNTDADSTLCNFLLKSIPVHFVFCVFVWVQTSMLMQNSAFFMQDSKCTVFDKCRYSKVRLRIWPKLEQQNNYSCFFEPSVFGAFVLFIEHTIYIDVDSIVRFKERTLHLHGVQN